MNLQDLIMKFMPVPVGVSQSRVTRTPVLPASMDSYVNGMYIDPASNSGHLGPLDMLKMYASGMGGDKAILVNPNKPELASTIAHEDIHAALAPVADALPRMADTNTANRIGQTLSVGRGGRDFDAATEVPAYMGAYDGASNQAVPQSLRDLYVSDFSKRLAAVNPAVARQYNSLAHPNAIGATAAAGENGGGQ